MLYYYAGILEKYRDIQWTDKVTIISFEKHENIKRSSFNYCPEYKTKRTFKLTNGKIVDYSLENRAKYENGHEGIKIKDIVYSHSNEKNTRCIKNHFFANFIVSKLNLEDQISKIRKNNKSGFALIKNPYIYGEVSISRTARYYPATLIFKPLMILSSFFLFLYWLNNLHIFNLYKKNNVSINFSKKFFYFGSLSCLFLIIHSIFLGIDFDLKIYDIFRRLVIILFIIFEIFAQIFLTVNLVKLSENLRKHISLQILKIKIFFVSLAAFVTVISFYILAFEDPTSNFKHMLEWNYFSFLLIYYFLSRLLWKVPKNQKS